MMAKFQDLISYFEMIATRHISIQHTQEKKHFFRMELDEVLEGINRSDVEYPLLILEGYSFNFTDNKSDNILKNRQGAFILLHHITDGSNHDYVHQVWDELEEIGTDILLKIKSDKRNPLTPAVRDFDLLSVEASLISNLIENNVGIRFTYNISSPTSTELNPGKWLPDE